MKSYKVQLISVLFILISTMGIISCNGDKKEESTLPMADTSQLNQTESAQPKNIDSTKKTVTVAETNPYVVLDISCSDLKQLSNKNRFVKFRFLRYRLNEADKMRLFCYALKDDITDDSDDHASRIGNPVFISENHDNENNDDPENIQDALITYPLLSLSKADFQTVLKTGSANSCLTLSFVPGKFTDNQGMAFEGYGILKDKFDTKIHLNPSPPGIAPKIVRNKKK